MNRRMSKLLLLTICVSTLAALTGCKAQTPLTPEEVLEKITTANSREELEKNTVAHIEKYKAEENEETVYTYVSKDVWFSHMGEDELNGFTYIGSDRCVGVDDETDGFLYSAIVDQAAFKETLDVYITPYENDFTDYKAELTGEGQLKLTGENDVYTYEYDPKKFLKLKETYTIDTMEEYAIVTDYEYLKKDDDKRIQELVDKYVNEKSGGKTIKLTVIDLDGSSKTFDFPYGFEALVYAKADAFYYQGDEDDYYMYEPLTEDTTLVGIEVEDEGEIIFDENGEVIEDLDWNDIEFDEDDFIYDEDGNVIR